MCVAGIENAHWVLDHLSGSFVFKTSEPMLEVEPPAYCIFYVVHGSQLSERELQRLLVAIPGVRLTLEQSLEEAA